MQKVAELLLAFPRLIFRSLTSFDRLPKETDDQEFSRVTFFSTVRGDELRKGDAIRREVITTMLESDEALSIPAISKRANTKLPTTRKIVDAFEKVGYAKPEVKATYKNIRHNEPISLLSTG